MWAFPIFREDDVRCDMMWAFPCSCRRGCDVMWAHDLVILARARRQSIIRCKKREEVGSSKCRLDIFDFGIGWVELFLGGWVDCTKGDSCLVTRECVALLPRQLIVMIFNAPLIWMIYNLNALFASQPPPVFATNGYFPFWPNGHCRFNQ